MKIEVHLVLEIKGERWISYPPSMKFPRNFIWNYPFRGRGIVSAVVYILHFLKIDRLLLKRRSAPLSLQDVAYFWPSARRSTQRFYGYRVVDGRVVEYLKFATTPTEAVVLKREAQNANLAADVSQDAFKVPRCLGYYECDGVCVVRYEPLPADAVTPPLNKEWLIKAELASNLLIRLGYTHGDFAWHNFKASSSHLWIIDWEGMGKNAPILTDRLNLFFSYWRYWRKGSQSQMYRDFMSVFGINGSIGANVRDAAQYLKLKGFETGRLAIEYIDQSSRGAYD